MMAKPIAVAMAIFWNSEKVQKGRILKPVPLFKECNLKLHIWNTARLNVLDGIKVGVNI